MSRPAENRSRGFVFIPVVLVLLVVGSIGLMMTTESALEAGRSATTTDAARARYVAEAGYRHALWAAERSSCSSYGDLTDTVFGADRYSTQTSPGTGSPVSIAALGQTASGAEAAYTSDDVPIYDLAGAQTVVLQPDAADGEDTWLYQWKPNLSYGSDATMKSGFYWTDSIARALLRFDVSEIPASAQIVSAQLELNASGPSESGGTIGVHRMAASWDEATASWNERQPGVVWTTPGGDFAPEVLASTDVASGASGWHAWDVSTLVQDWVAGRQPNHGLMLRVTAFGKGTELDTSDAVAAANHPRLTIVYACECGGGDGDTAIFQPGPSDGKDAWISGSKPQWNYGVANKLDIVEGAPQRGVIAFDLSGLPPDAIVQNARLELFATGVQASGAGDAFAHVITDDWLEGSCLGSGCVADGVTWDWKDGVTPWIDPGVDHVALPLDATYVGTGGAWYTWDVTEAAADWVSTGVNHGLLIKGLFGGANVDFASSDEADPTIRPRLVVDYDCRCGVCSGGPPSCSGDYVPTLEVGSWPYGGGSNFNDLHGLTWVPEGFVLDGVAAPAGGGWVAVDWNEPFFTLYDVDGNVLGQSLATPSGNMNGVAFVESGARAGWLAVVEASPTGDTLFFVDPTGTESTVEIDLGGFASRPSGVSYIAQSASGSYDEHLAISDANSDQIFIVDQSGGLVETITPVGGAGSLQGIAHLHGTDRFLTVDDADDLARVVDLTGTVTSSYTLTAFIFDSARAVAVHSGSCDHVIASNALAASSNPDEVVSLNQGAPPSPTPLAHWPFDDATGPTAFDAENDHDGTLTNDPLWGNGLLAGGLVFDGSDDSVVVPHDDALSLTSFSIAAWARADAVGGWRIVLSKGSTTSVNYYLGLHEDELSIGFNDAGVWSVFETIDAGLSAGPWHHLGGSFDAVTGDLRLYVNGSLLGSGVTASTPPANAEDLQIGRSAFGEYWQGTLDDVRLYSRALSATEVSELAAEGPSCAETVADDFETGDYAGSTGTLAWGGPWLEVAESDGPGSGDEVVETDDGDLALRLRDNDGGGEGVERAVDLSGYAWGTLRLTTRRDGLDDSDDYVTVEAWDASASSWVELDRALPPPGTDAASRLRVYGLSPYLGPDTRLRFLTSSTLGNLDAVYLDDVEICVGN